MGDSGSSVISNVIELAVGVACLLGGVGMWRKPGLRLVGGVVIVAGLAAVVHALVALT